MHVAVLDGRMLQQRTDFGQLVDDHRIGLPDVHAAKERQIGGIGTIALHRGQDLLVVHAVLLARLEILDPVSRRRVHDAGTGVHGHVVAEENR